MFEPALSAADEFHAGTFIAAHGWYRQATAALRTAPEHLAIGARYAVRDDLDGYAAWQAGETEPAFGNAADLLGRAAPLEAIELRLGGQALFGRDGVLRDLHGRLSRYAHGRAGHKNADIWAR